MKILLFLSLFSTLLAQEIPKKSAPQPRTSDAPILSMDNQNRSVLVIDPKARANDYVYAFDALRKDKPTLRISIRTFDTIFNGVTDISATPGGTLLLVKVASNQGLRAQVVPLEQIVEINYSP